MLQHQLNRALLGTLMSAETADIVADRIEHLEAEVTGTKKEIARLNARLEAGRGYLMQTSAITVDETLVAFGWTSDGLHEENNQTDQ